MAGGKWYEGLGPQGFEGVHARAVFDGGSAAEGTLRDDGHGRVVLVLGLPGGDAGAGPHEVPVLVRGDGAWRPADGVLWVDRIWSESDWEAVRPKDARMDDAALVDGRLWRVRRIRANGSAVLQDGNGDRMDLAEPLQGSPLVDGCLRLRRDEDVERERNARHERGVDSLRRVMVPVAVGFLCFILGFFIASFNPAAMAAAEAALGQVLAGLAS